MNGFTAAALRRLAIAARAPGLGPARLAQIEAVEWSDPRELVRLGLTTASAAWLAAPDEALVDSDLRWLETAGATLLPATSPRYPSLLRETPDAPALLYVLGQPQVLNEPQLAMVGSRNPTAG